MNNSYFKGILFSLSFVFLSSCLSLLTYEPDPDDNQSRKNNIEYNNKIKVTEQAVSVQGGSIVVNAPSSVINGMKIEIAPDSYSDQRQFTISTADISSHDFGENFKPITPMIIIDNGGGYAGNLMEVSIPIDLPQGHIPLGFYYDDVNGKLEAIPV